MTLVPGKKVASLLARNPAGGGELTAPGSLCQLVSCRKTNTPMIATPNSPIIHQNSSVQDLPDEMKAEIVGPPTVPKSSAQWKAVKALPL